MTSLANFQELRYGLIKDTARSQQKWPFQDEEKNSGCVLPTVKFSMVRRDPFILHVPDLHTILYTAHHTLVLPRPGPEVFFSTYTPQSGQGLSESYTMIYHWNIQGSFLIKMHLWIFHVEQGSCSFQKNPNRSQSMLPCYNHLPCPINPLRAKFHAANIMAADDLAT